MAAAKFASRVDREQLPRLLRPFDDPYGITWRMWNQLRRLSVRRTARFLVGFATPPHYERPVFILGVPRSGTTMLFLLRTSSHLGALPGEGHDVWRMYHHPRYSGWRSDAVGADEVGLAERRFVNAYFYSYVGRQRFVEKTPENCLRVPYLLDLFPDAIFVVIRRNPCDVINSLINGWRHPAGRYRSYFVPEDLDIPGYDARRRWCFALIDGWRDLKTAPVPEIALAQWQQTSAGLDAAQSLVPPEQWTELSLEELLSDPSATLARVYEHIGIPNEPALEAKLTELLANPINALTPPGQDKWRAQNANEIRPLLPRIMAHARITGYDPDPATGTIPRRGPSSS
jgi:hypothetical protein